MCFYGVNLIVFSVILNSIAALVSVILNSITALVSVILNSITALVSAADEVVWLGPRLSVALQGPSARRCKKQKQALFSVITNTIKIHLKSSCNRLHSLTT